MLSATSVGSWLSSPSSLSAAGQDEQPWLVNNSTTPRVSAPAPAGSAAISAAPPTPITRRQTVMTLSTCPRPQRRGLSLLPGREIKRELQASDVLTADRRPIPSTGASPRSDSSILGIVSAPFTRYSLQGEGWGFSGWVCRERRC